eukprot:gene11854-5183_t
MGNESSVLAEAHNDLEFFEENKKPVKTVLFPNRQQYKHDDVISDILVINSRYFITGTSGNTIKVWDLNEKYYEIISPKNDEKITCLAKIDDKRIATGGNFGTINIRSLYSGKISFSIKESASINCILALDDDIFLAGVGSKVVVWDLKTQSFMFHIFSHKRKVHKLLEIKKNVVASCGFDGKICIYDFNRHIEIEFHAKSKYIRDIVFTRNFIICCGDAKLIEFFHLTDKTKSFHISTEEILNRIVTDGQMIIGVGSKIHLFDFHTKKLLKSISAHKDHISEILFYGHLFVTSGDDKSIKIWNKNGFCLDTLRGHKTCISKIQECDGFLFSYGYSDEIVYLWSYHVHAKFPYFAQTNKLNNISFNFHEI